MPRRQNTPGQYASKNSVRSRKFSVVIHDVKPQAKAELEKVISELQPDWSLIAEEEYNHQEGSHIHLFIKYDQPKAKSKVLTFIQNLELGGRVQVDIGRGDFDQCRKYITDPDKVKNLDSNISENVRTLSLIERYPEHARTCPGCGIRYYDPPYDTFGTGEITIQGACHKCSWKDLFERHDALFPEKIISNPYTTDFQDALCS